MPTKPYEGAIASSRSLDLRSTDTMTHIQGNQSSRQETGRSGDSLQVISPVSPPPGLNTNSDGDLCKSALKSEMTTSDNAGFPMTGLPKSEFVPSGGGARMSDTVTMEKQRLHEDRYVSGDSWSASEARREHGAPMMMTQQSSNCSTSDDSMLSLGSDCSTRSGPQPTSVSHNVNQTSRYERQPIPPEEYPAEFKEHQYDCVLIYCDQERDRKMAVHFKDIITKHVVLENGCHPQICILDRNDNLTYIQSRFKHVDLAMDRSTYMFLMITRAFVEDGWAEMQKDECLMNSIEEPDRKWCVVPLHTKGKKQLDFRYPYGLRALKGVDISVMLNDALLEDADPESIETDDIDHFFLQNITRMFNQRLEYKLRRERDQEIELQRWIRKEEIRRLKKAIDEEHRQQQLKARHDREVRLMEEEAQRTLERLELGKPVEGIDTEPSRAAQPPLANQLQNTLNMLLGLGMTLQDAVAMLHAQQPQTAAVPGVPPGVLPAGIVPPGVSSGLTANPVTYNIHNYGSMQVGSKNTQSVKTDGADDEISHEDGTEYVIVDTPATGPVLQTDAPPSEQSSDPVEPVPMPLRDAPTPGGGTEAQMGRTIAQDTQGQGQPAAGQGQMRSSLQASLDRTYSTPSQETQHNIVSQPVTTAPRRSAGDGQSNGTYARAPLKANTVTGQNLSSSSGSQSQSSPSLSLRSDGPDSDQVTGHGNGQGESMGESIVLDIKTSGGGW